MPFPDLMLLVTVLGDSVCAVAALANGDSVLSLLGYLNDFSALGTISKSELLSEINSLTPSERQTLEQQLITKFQTIAQPEVQAKAIASVNDIEALIAYGYQVYPLITQGVALVKQIQSLVTTP